MPELNDLDQNLPAPNQGVGTFPEDLLDEDHGFSLDDVPIPGDEAAPQGDVQEESRLGRAAGAIGAGAADTSRTFMEGISAMRDVSRAKREHSSARARLEELKISIEEMQAELDHRTSIERNFDSIMAEQGEALTRAQAERDDAQRRIDGLNAEHERLSQQLAQLKVDNEARLRPYRNLMDSTRGRAEDAARSLKEAQRAVRKAESALAEANSRRDQQVSLANRAVDNANARLAKLNDELASLTGSAHADATTIAQVEQSVANEQIHLATAKSEVLAVTDETQRAVDSAQAHLLTQQQSLEVAERANDAARQEAEQRKAEYERLYQDAQTDEATLDNAVVEREMGVRDVTKEQAAAQARVDAAQAVIDEATDVNSTPERTRSLRRDITSSLAELEAQGEAVSSLARAERDLREATKRSRTVFKIVVAVAALVALLVLWLVFGSGCTRKAATDDATPPAALEASQPEGQASGDDAKGNAGQQQAEGSDGQGSDSTDDQVEGSEGQATEGSDGQGAQDADAQDAQDEDASNETASEGISGNTVAG